MWHLRVLKCLFCPVSVRGTADAEFKWFMLQARDVKENIPVGSFQITDPNTQGHDCYNMTVGLISLAWLVSMLNLLSLPIRILFCHIRQKTA